MTGLKLPVHLLILFSVACLTHAAAPPAAGSDAWPMYQHDPARSGVADAAIEFPLQPAWTYRPSQPPRPAWPRPIREVNRMAFDYAPQPVIAGGRVYFASSADDTVRALDAATGAVRWRFTTGGPVRFAPSVAGGRAYLASDDGYAYCLDAASGKPVWTFRAAPRADQVVGNGRMISRWPCRSGVLVQDGVVYGSAGIWPTESVFLYALDARSGSVKWRNDTAGFLYARLPHVASGFSGVTPQGYLLAGKDVLLVPTGRSVPAGFDRRTGRLLYYDPQGREYGTQYYGGTWCLISGNTYYNNSSDRAGRIGIASYALASGRQSGRAGRGGRRLVVGNGHSVYWTGSQLVGRDSKGKSWKVACGDAYRMAMAGEVLLVGGAGRIRALHAGTGRPIWEAAVEGEARGIAVAAGRLIVSTTAGTVYCFAAGQGGAAVVTGDPRLSTRPSAPSPALGAVAKLCETAGISRGYALVVGEADAALARGLATRTTLHVVSALRDRAKVDAWRELLLKTTAFYGSRLAVQHLSDRSRLPYPTYVANLIVVGRDTGRLSAAELYRVLRPCGGVMCFPGLDAGRARAFLKDAGIPEAEIGETAGLPTVTRGKLPGAFDWDSKVSLDQRVKWPLELTWFGGPGTAPKTENSCPVAAEGRIFMAGANHIVAVDAYNGTTLWSHRVSWDHNTGLVRPMPRPGSMYHFGGLAADVDTVYLHMKNKLSIEFDARSGALRKYYGLHYASKSFSLAAAQSFSLNVDEQHTGTVTVTKSPDELVLRLVTKDPKVCQPWERNPYTRQISWENGDYWDLFFDFRPAEKRFGFYGPGAFHISVVPAGPKPVSAYAGAGPRHPAFSVKGTTSPAGTDTALHIPWAGIEKITGRRPRDFGFGVILSSFDGGRSKKGKRTYQFADINAYGVNNGWATLVLDGDARPASPPKAFAALASPDETLPAGVLKARLPASGRRGRTGPKNRRRHPLTGEPLAASYLRSHGCGGFICSQHADFFRSGVVGIYDFADDSGLRNFGGTRLSCGISAMPALGVLFADCTVSHCVCGYNIKCMLALAPAARRRNEDWALFSPTPPMKSVLRHAALNLGAPGDRRDSSRTAWLAFPRALSRLTLSVPMRIEIRPGLGPYHINTDRVKVEGTDRPWIYGSGIRGLEYAELRLDPARPPVSLPAGRAPKIDGRLDDPCWDGREALPFGVGTVRDRIFLRHDATHLYLAFRAPPSRDRAGSAKPWKTATQGADAQVWLDDACELFLSDAKRKAYVQLGVSASGARYDGCCTYPKDRRDVGAKWTGAWQSAAAAGADGLVIEMAVPWTTLAAAGVSREQLRINIRARRRVLRNLGIRRYEKQARTFVPLSLGAPKPTAPREATIRLHFCEPDDVRPGERVFDVRLQGATVLRDFDVVKEAGGPRRALVKEFAGVKANEVISIRLVPKKKNVRSDTAPILNGLEVTLP